MLRVIVFKLVNEDHQNHDSHSCHIFLPFHIRKKWKQMQIFLGKGREGGGAFAKLVWASQHFTITLPYFFLNWVEKCRWSSQKSKQEYRNPNSWTRPVNSRPSYYFLIILRHKSICPGKSVNTQIQKCVYTNTKACLHKYKQNVVFFIEYVTAWNSNNLCFVANEILYSSAVSAIFW